MKEAYPRFLALLRERGYVESTIGKYRWVINRLLAEAQSHDILSFEDYYAILKENLSSKSMPEVRTYLGAFKHYACEESVTYPGDKWHLSRRKVALISASKYGSRP